MLLAFAEEVDRKPVPPGDPPPAAEASDEPRRVRRRTGRRNLAHFENLPLTPYVHELSAGLAHAQESGKRLGRPVTAAAHAA